MSAAESTLPVFNSLVDNYLLAGNIGSSLKSKNVAGSTLLGSGLRTIPALPGLVRARAAASGAVRSTWCGPAGWSSFWRKTRV
jgi:hypothetical protein